MLNKTFSPWPSYTADEIKAVSRVLQSNKVNYWTGDEGKKFEKEYAEWVGVNHAVALANGTLALELALHALGIGRGDEVVVTARSFIASASCVVLAGAVPVFADVDLDSQNITAETISAVLTTKTRAILCVHHAGWPCDMDEILSLASANGIYVIEDCAQAHGAQINGKSVGGHGHVAAWSFCQDKIITTGGEGGMVTTNDESLWRKMWEYKEHGKSYDKTRVRNTSNVFSWVHDSFGSNMRMTEMQATIGRLQVKKMHEWHSVRTRNANRLCEILAEHRGLIRLPAVPANIEHAWYKFYAFIKPEGIAPHWDRNRIINEIAEQGVPCYSGSCPEIYLEKAFNNSPYRPSRRLPHASMLGETSVMFLVHPGITEDEFNHVEAVIHTVLKKATRS